MTLSLLFRLFLLSALILLLILVSGCTTTPVQPPLQKPVTCLLPVPDHLLFLPPGFEAFTPHDKAVTLLDLHSQDGEAYAVAVAQLRDCQAFIQALP